MMRVGYSERRSVQVVCMDSREANCRRDMHCACLGVSLDQIEV
jgi:hypothetical protein